MLAIAVASLTISLSIELVEFVSLFLYSREKANRDLYDKPLVSYGVAYILLFILSLAACMILLFLPFGILG